MQRNGDKALNDYWKKQPELNDPEFLALLQKAYEIERKDPRQRVIPIWELAKYRLNNRIPNTLSFESRKNLLINSEEWNGWIYKNNKHLSEDELTEDNIQKEIETVGTCWGIEITKRFHKLEWIPIAMDSGLCKIFIP